MAMKHVGEFIWMLLVTSSLVIAAPIAQNSGISGSTGEQGNPDMTVQELEKLKHATTNKEVAADINREHVEFHSLDAVKENGELVSRLEQHASADKVPGENPQIHAQAKLDMPSEGVHRTIVQEGDKVSVVEETQPSTTPGAMTTMQVFRGAARQVACPSCTATNITPKPHTAERRSFNADITKETKNNMDHYSSYSGVQYSPLDMAEYVFWTGDEKGVTSTVEEFLQEGLMSKEEAINFLQEIKFNLDYLRAHYSQGLRAAEESAQHEKLKALMMEQAATKEYQYRSPSSLSSFPFGSSPDIIRSIATKNWEMSNNLSPVPMLPIASELRPEPVKRYDPMLQSNVVSTSDYDRDGPMMTEGEYEEMMEKLKIADSLYTEYTLEEIIYQLAKMMFSQSLSRDPASARASTQRFMTFLEAQAEKGQLSRSIEKKVLDVMIAALSDTIGDHPELFQSRDVFGLTPANRLIHQFLEASSSDPGMSRAILAAYKDELLKGPPLHKFAYSEKN